ncbi:MAG: hypothetical protein ACI9UN_000043 [Granulosicoccus sp.]|jgi:hypothetical protein
MSHSVLRHFLTSSPGLSPARLSSVILGLALSSAGYAAVEVNSIITSDIPATPFTYTKDGIEYRWGMGSNQYMEGFTTTEGRVYSYTMSADRVEVLRDDVTGVTTGKPCGIFVERIGETLTSRSFAADYPSDGSGTGNCDLSALLSSRVINRGAVDLFSNKLPDAKNVERLDYLFDFGVLAPFEPSDMALAGHAVAEKSSNNPVKVAAILELDVFGQPAAYGPLVFVGESFCLDEPICYHLTDLQHTYSFLQNDFNEPQGFPVETERSRETVGMAFLSMNDLGLKPGQRYHGLSIFADDVDAEQHNLLDPSSFPNNTSDDNVTAGDDADIYGGMAGFFLEGAVTVASGSVFIDANGDGIPAATEAGISSIAISFYTDVNGNGLLDVGVDLQLGDSIDSDMVGNFVLPGIPDGNFLVVLDSNDTDLPPGLVSSAGSNPYPLAVTGSDIDTVNFPFVSGDETPPNDDVLTAALDDSFEVNQGSSIIYDVLENDTDGVGGGLTLRSVSESPNAVISMLNNQVSYQPDFGFYNTGDTRDTFFYVMQDADGTEFTGNVSVNVIRYSDLNDNMINDFVECECTNLVLETGVHGSGIGRFSFAGSLVLLMAVWIRRRAMHRRGTGVAIAEVD